MSRSAADATRFTATGPYVGPKAPYKLPEQTTHRSPKTSSSAPSQQHQQQQQQQHQQQQQGEQQQETPRQKVERLRAQARAARLSQSGSRIERLLERGRRSANGAHKVIIYTLIAASGVCGALTLYSAVSLTMWNRRQRELWLDRQLQELQSAREAYVAGTATPEQLEILRNEKIGEIQQQKIKEAQEQKLWNRAKRFLFDGMKTTEKPETAKVGVLEALNASKADEFATSPASTAVPASSATTSVPTQPGQLDVLAANVEMSAKQSAKSWSDWILRR